MLNNEPEAVPVDILLAAVVAKLADGYLELGEDDLDAIEGLTLAIDLGVDDVNNVAIIALRVGEQELVI